MNQSINVSENKKVNTGDEKKSGSLTSVVVHLFATLIDKGVLTPEEVENIFKRI
ncbi:hypothetical protein [Bacillus sp. 196mf]|uniref:hypothetical protein n=1 Tax=Bacillus sp. 196mf TaxID=1761754 RepID=UPI000D88EFB5|nr:hypothetical protein [Bacillus sp. 196mf]PYE86454.1 hypothetical protein ATL10_11232 [Bacillus sp. 196mf]